MNIDTKTLKEAFAAIYSKTDNRAFSHSTWIKEWGGKEWLCFTDGRKLLMMRIESGHGLPKEKFIPLRKELFALSPVLTSIDPIDDAKCKINGIEVAYEEGVPPEVKGILHEEGIECEYYNKLDPDYLVKIDKFFPNFWRATPTVASASSRCQPLMWRNNDKIVVCMPVR